MMGIKKKMMILDLFQHYPGMRPCPNLALLLTPHAGILQGGQEVPKACVSLTVMGCGRVPLPWPTFSGVLSLFLSLQE